MASLTENIADWLLQGDPAIRWQVKRDLLNLDEQNWNHDRQQIAHKGWGKALLDHRQPDGLWAGAYYSPKWTSTHYSLMLLFRMGLPPDNLLACESIRILLDRGLYRDGGINYFKSLKQSETCVTGMTLSLCSGFDIPYENFGSIVNFLLGEQMEDGGWNCEAYRGARHSSMHTTINVLEGLWAFEKKYLINREQIRQARKAAHRFLLKHHLYRSDHTGRIINKKFIRLPFPPRWYYDILRALDYFQDCHAGKDDRMEDAISILVSREKEGMWPLQAGYPAREFFKMEKAGKSSRWNTLRALRVMEWWNR
jgi:hypothetical protein